MSASVITIDGPAASGKSSVSRELAARLGWKWVSTGAFYRGLAWVAVEEKLDFNDIQSLAALCNDPMWRVDLCADRTAVVYRGREVSELVFAEANAEKASQVSKIQE